MGRDREKKEKEAHLRQIKDKQHNNKNEISDSPNNIFFVTCSVRLKPKLGSWSKKIIVASLKPRPTGKDLTLSFYLKIKKEAPSII